MRKAIVLGSLLALAASGPLLAEDANDRAAVQNQQGAEATNDTEQTVPYKAAASNLMDLEVQDAQGEDIGTVQDLLLDDDNQISHIVISDGGMMGIGGRDVAVEIDQFEIQQENVIYSGTRDQLEQLPEFAYAEEADHEDLEQARVGEDEGNE